MANDLRNFRQFPGTVRRATILLFSGWALFYVYYFQYLDRDSFSIQQTLVGVLCCLCFLTFRNWARVLAILCNIMFIFQFILPCVVFFSAGKFVQAIITGLMILMFVMATYYLLVKESAEFFKSYHAPAKNH